MKIFRTRKIKEEKQKEIHRLQQTVNKLNKANKSLKNHSIYTDKAVSLESEVC